MDDLISRREAIESVTCEITVHGIKETKDVCDAMGQVADQIKAIPSAQPEIIRCKDCRHYDYWGQCKKLFPYTDKTLIFSEDDYCSYAEGK